jgi:hypothetical protein
MGAMKTLMPTLRAARRPVRVWMTGSIAVVMAAMVQLRGETETDPENDARTERPRRVALASPYGVAETVLRIETAAAQRGLQVLWRDDRGDAVLVLASSAGGTPVAFDGEAARTPMALRVLPAGEGAAQVLMPAESGALAGALRSVSPQAADELALLPLLVERALT